MTEYTKLSEAGEDQGGMSTIGSWRSAGLLLAAFGALMLFAVSGVDARPQQSQRQQTTGPGEGENDLVIETDSELPDTYPQADYQFRFRARGGVPALHWRLEKGALPPGMTLEADGLLHGKPERVGEFEFVLSVRDGSQPQQAVQKGFLLRVRSALSLKWKNPAHVAGSRIEGTVEVSNTTPDDIDLTFIVMAVQGNGRATAIGYQHLLLRRGTMEQELPFGETLPRGGYVVHVDAVGEVGAKNLIYRDRLQTPGPLQVSIGP